MADNQTDSDLPLPQSYIDAIKGFEGFTPKAQWDYSQHSNGYGTRARYPGEVIDRQEATDRLHRELGSAAAQVDARFPNLPEGHRAALTSLTYNAGPGWMRGGLGAAVGAGDWDTAKRLFLGYNHAGGQVLPGLVNRRASEAAWLSGATPGPGAALPPVAAAPFSGMSGAAGASAAPSTAPPPVPTALAPPVSGVQSLLAGLGSPDNKGTSTFGDIGKSLMATAGKSKGLPFPDAAKLKPFDENLRPLPLNLPNFAALAQIPKFAEGGIVDRPTVAMVGENGPEAIVPLRPMTTAEPDVIGNRIGAVPAVHNFMSDLLTVLKNKAVRVATAPLDAFTGRMQVSDPMTGMPTPEAMNRGSEVAGAALTGAIPFARSGSAGIFGGRLAQGANLSELEAAKTFAEHGAHPDDIWKSTGWFQGADAKWRHEVPDTSAKFSSSPPISGKLPDLLTEHPLLYAAYPQLKNANFKIVPGEGASYFGKIKNEHTFHFGEKTLNRDPSVVLHEIQHAVQGEEGFAKGGAQEQGPYKSPFEEDLRKLRDERDQIYKKYKSVLDRPPEVAARLKYINAVTNTNLRLQDAYGQEAFQNYRRLAGETEARNVQNRFRKVLSNNPYWSEDIPRNEQIVSPFAVMTGPKAVGLPGQMAPLEGVPRGFDPFGLQR